jgi:trans-aconitate methyltransferase
MTDAERAEFFASGDSDVSATFQTIGEFAAEFRPELAVDFGCGVGRLTIPLAKRCGQVIGADVSPTMLAEAARNASTRGIANARFLQSESLWDALAATPPDFVHSYIVFQHILPAEGMRITARLLERLRPGGVGALHYVLKWRPGWIRRKVSEMRRVIAPLNVALNAVQRRPLFEPSIPVFEYSDSALRGLLQQHSCDLKVVMPTDHGGFLGATYVFQKE